MGSSDTMGRVQAYLRGRPVLRAILWAIGCFVLMSLVHMVRSDGLTAEGAIRDLGQWTLAGVVFYFLMRWRESRDAR